MSRDKLVSVEAVKRALENAYYGEATLGELLETLDELSPVEQPMSAREYAKAKWQMCKSAFYCENCPMIVWRDLDDSRSCSEWAAKYPEKAVAIVGAWAREHPEERSED